MYHDPKEGANIETTKQSMFHDFRGFTRTRGGALINKIAESHMKKVYILIFTFIINYYLWIRNGR